MNLKEQKYVCTLAKSGSISSACNILHISPPALSTYISNLEKNLGYNLFLRHGRKFTLTKAGALYVRNALKMLELKEHFEYEVVTAIKGERNLLRVSFQDIRSVDMSHILIGDFYNRFPNWDLVWHEENYGEMEKRLEDGNVDMIFCNIPYKKKEFEYTSIATDTLAFIVPANSAILRGAKYDEGALLPFIDIKLFKNERFLLQRDGQSTRNYSNRVFKSANISPVNIFTIRKMMTMIALVERGFGVGFCPRGYLDYAKSLSNVRAFRVDESSQSVLFCEAHLKNTEMSEPMKFLIDKCREIMGN